MRAFDPRLLPSAAVVAVSLMLLPAAQAMPALVPVVLTILAFGVFSFGFAAFLLRRDKYDLGRLREIHERAEMPDVDQVGTADEIDSVLCMACGETYPDRLPACPHCLRRNGKSAR